MKKTRKKTRGRKNRESSRSFKPHEPVPDLMSLAGKFKVKNPLDPIETREYMKKNYEQL